MQPELLDQHIRNQQIHLKYEPELSTTENWQKIKTIIQEALVETYPAIRKDNSTQIWERVGYENATPEEKQRYLELKKERQEIQDQINKQAKKITQIENKIKKAKIFKAWKDASEFIKNNKSNILYARKPIINLSGETKITKNVYMTT